MTTAVITQKHGFQFVANVSDGARTIPLSLYTRTLTPRKAADVEAEFVAAVSDELLAFIGACQSVATTHPTHGAPAIEATNAVESSAVVLPENSLRVEIEETYRNGILTRKSFGLPTAIYALSSLDIAIPIKRALRELNFRKCSVFGIDGSTSLITLYRIDLSQAEIDAFAEQLYAAGHPRDIPLQLENYAGYKIGATSMSIKLFDRSMAGVVDPELPSGASNIYCARYLGEDAADYQEVYFTCTMESLVSWARAAGKVVAESFPDDGLGGLAECAVCLNPDNTVKCIKQYRRRPFFTYDSLAAGVGGYMPEEVAIMMRMIDSFITEYSHYS
jgi:hypothetical protein